MECVNGGSVLLVFAALILAMSACAPANGEVPELTSTRWRLVSYGEPGSEIPVIEDTEVTLQFDEENRAGGSGGCNTFGAEYEVANDRLSFGEIESTLIGCIAEGVMEQEAEYYDALWTAEEFELTEDELRIWYGDGHGVLNFVRIEPA